jgi:hypothetical protein
MILKRKKENNKKVKTLFKPRKAAVRKLNE